MKATSKLAAAMGLAFVSVVGLPAARAQAQQAMRVVINSDGGGPSSGQVSKRNIERYAEVAGFSAEQKDSAMTIHEGYAAAYKEAQKARRAAMEDLQRSASETDDHSVFMEKLPGVEKEYREKTTKLEKGLFDDLKALCGADQEAKWPKVERMRRREVGLRSGAVAGEGVDLVEVVGGLKLAPDAAKGLAALMDEYEMDIDGQIKARETLTKDAPQFEPGKGLDIEAMQKSMAAAREAGLKIKDVNDRFGHKIEPLLPEDKQAEFRTALRRASFPAVYRPSRVNRDLDKALALKDLTSDQRAKLMDIKNGYEKSAAPVNDAWASAIQEADKSGDGNSGVMSGPGGSRMMLKMNDDPKALADAKKARREIDDKARDRMKGVLNESQQAAIKPTRGEQPDEEEGGAFMIHTVTEDK